MYVFYMYIRLHGIVLTGSVSQTPYEESEKRSLRTKGPRCFSCHASQAGSQDPARSGILPEMFLQLQCLGPMQFFGCLVVFNT